MYDAFRNSVALERLPAWESPISYSSIGDAYMHSSSQLTETTEERTAQLLPLCPRYRVWRHRDKPALRRREKLQMRSKREHVQFGKVRAIKGRIGG
jgi:hypothetical protein